MGDAAIVAEKVRALFENGGELREWKILGMLATGATNGQIASALVVSESTVKSHVKRILHKLPAANRAEAVYRYTQLSDERSRVP